MLSPYVTGDNLSKEDLFNTDFSKTELTFRNLLFEDTKDIKKIGDYIKKEFKNYVVVGIGGSDLGSRVISSAFKSKSDTKVSFIGANTDPQEIEDFFENIDAKDCIFNVISKSGETVEVISNFLYILSWIKRKLGEENIKKHIIITTANIESTLGRFGKRFGMQIIEGREDVGDRFSVLSVIGLLTADVLGLDIDMFLKGARDLDKSSESSNPLENDPLLFAELSYLNYMNFGKNISVIMPYSSSLHNFGFWFRQLWAESLGKKNNKGENVGITPIAALGSTDQHSQMQLYNEGPNDKIITFIEVSQFNVEPSIDLLYDESKYLYKKSFNEIIHIERTATAISLKENNRANGTIFLDKISEENMGALFYFFELAVSYLGVFLEVNAFDQPGVERGKEYMYALLGKGEYKDLKTKLEDIINE